MINVNFEDGKGHVTMEGEVRNILIEVCSAICGLSTMVEAHSEKEEVLAVRVLVDTFVSVLAFDNKLSIEEKMSMFTEGVEVLLKDPKPQKRELTPLEKMQEILKNMPLDM